MLSASLNKTFLSLSVKQHSFPLCLKVLHCVAVMSPAHAAPVYIHRMHACVCVSVLHCVAVTDPAHAAPVYTHRVRVLYR